MPGAPRRVCEAGAVPGSPGVRRLTPTVDASAGSGTASPPRPGPLPRECCVWPPRLAAVLVVLVPRPVAARPATSVTIAHEGAHGLVALAVGPPAGRHPAALGHLGPHRLLRAARPAPAWCSTCAAGYTGPALFGLGAAALLAAGHAVGAALGAGRACSALLLVQIRNWYGLWSVLVTGGLVFAATWWLPRRGQAVFAAAHHLVPAAGRAARRRGAAARPPAPAGADSDADQLARLTALPGAGLGRVLPPRRRRGAGARAPLAAGRPSAGPACGARAASCRGGAPARLAPVRLVHRGHLRRRRDVEGQVARRRPMIRRPWWWTSSGSPLDQPVGGLLGVTVTTSMRPW